MAISSEHGQVTVGQSEKMDTKLARMTQKFLNEYYIFKSVYDQIEEAYNYLAGNQYTETQKKWFEQQRRPYNVFNLIFPTFNTVFGDFLASLLQQKIYPHEGGTPETAEAINKIIDNITINTEYKDEIAKTTLAGLCKYGVSYPRFSNERQIDGSIVIGNVDEFEVIFDSRARHYFCDDGQYMARTRWMDTAQILNAWPNHKRKLIGLLRDQKDDAYWERFDETSINLMKASDASA